MSKLSFQDRLNCPHSFGTEETPDLQCDYSFCDRCDGTIWEHCLWDMSESMKMKVLAEEESKDDN